MVEKRCMMHGYALVMGSVFGHPWARNILKLCQSLVSAVKSSHKLTNWLRVEFQLLRDNDVQHKHLTWLYMLQQLDSHPCTIACTQCMLWRWRSRTWSAHAG
ncbi:TPA: hypothetical protein ACH3X1_000703 [Trebouxia sp. C0004]